MVVQRPPSGRSVPPSTSMTDSSLRDALRERYRIERELGAGGMATVYLAHDLRNDRPVAIKVLRPELAAAVGADRFLKEIKTTANLQHPHILPLFDSGDAGGLLYYVMPYVAGETLRDRLRRETRLPVADAARITSEVCSALDYAHRHGVIHRDIKPENILLHDGHALVCDFGIALAGHAGDSRMTATGISIGTPAYMSPEQALGDRQLDARTDVYAVGVMLYEMLKGAPPFTGATAQAIVAQVLTQTPTPPSRDRSDIPAYLDRTVMTALQKDPTNRFSSAEAMRASVETPAAERAGERGRPRARWLAIGAVGVVGLAVFALSPKGTRAVPASTHKPDTAAARLVAEASGFATRRDQRSCSESIKLFSRAAARDTLYAAAWSGLAKARALCALFSAADPNIEFAAARGPAETALRLDAKQADAWVARGMVRLFREQDFDAARRDLGMAIKNDSTRYEPWLYLTWVHLANDHLDSALASVRRAKQIEPVNAPIVRVRLATLLRITGDLDGARREIDDVLRMDSTGHLARTERFELNLVAGRCDLARVDIAAVKGDPNPYQQAMLASHWAKCGKRVVAQHYADSLVAEAASGGFVDEFALSIIFSALGDSTNVLRWMERAVSEHNWALFYMRHHHAFRDYVTRPEYLSLMRRAHVR